VARPVGMIKLTTRFISSLVSMCAEIITPA
jgi:hypothetical protein